MRGETALGPIVISVTGAHHLHILDSLQANHIIDLEDDRVVVGNLEHCIHPSIVPCEHQLIECVPDVGALCSLAKGTRTAISKHGQP